MALLQRRQAATASEDAELQTAQSERHDAYAAYTVAAEAHRAAHDPEGAASYLDRITSAADELRARNRLAAADQRLARVEEIDRRRRRERVEGRLRPLCRDEIALLRRVEEIEMEKSLIIREANETGVAVSQDWVWIPACPEPLADESAFRVWERWLSPRL